MDGKAKLRHLHHLLLPSLNQAFLLSLSKLLKSHRDRVMRQLQESMAPPAKRQRHHDDGASSSASAPHAYGDLEDATSDKFSVLKEPPPSTELVEQPGTPPQLSTPLIAPRGRPPPQVSAQLIEQPGTPPQLSTPLIEPRGRPPPQFSTPIIAPQGRPLPQFSTPLIAPQGRPPPQVSAQIIEAEGSSPPQVITQIIEAQGRPAIGRPAIGRPAIGDFASGWNFNLDTPEVPLELPDVRVEWSILDALPPERTMPEGMFRGMERCIKHHSQIP